MNEIVGTHSILFLTLDTLRHDVAASAFAEGTTPNLTKLVAEGWEERHTPGTFTWAAHQAFFAGFLPTPAAPGRHPRLFAADFEGSETTTKNTFVFKETDIVSALRTLKYRTVCIGGVGFFNKRTALGNAMPSLFEESSWNETFGVTDPESARNQFSYAAQWIREVKNDEKFFMFINVSAIHQPNYFYKAGEASDSLATHRSALEYVDSCLPILTDALALHGDTFCILCADHGTAYGEEGYTGHRFSHPVVLTVPYAETILKKRDE
ncbi:STM4013/SEN3800 family hydrolase [Chryseolinea sp. T2]|uniref:STM4013/SEN3800 family hydrolase n=1 Tax=Chryseolinea sp. T2 TaxID=3129255 RepID=UPI003076E112